MKIVFDFDDVIFNAKAFKELMFFFLSEKGITNAKGVYEEMRRREKMFSVVRYLDNLGIKKEERAQVYEGIMAPCEWLVHTEVLSVINEIGKENIFILSQGDEAFQRDKIERALNDKVLGSHVVVVPDSKAEELRRVCEMYKDEEIIFVDDKVEFLNDLPVSELPNLKTVLFNSSGVETLRREMEESKKYEQKMVKETIQKETSSGGSKMR